MAAIRNTVIFVFMACVICPALGQNPRRRRPSSEVELVEARNTTNGGNVSGDFTITGNPALDTTLVTTIGSLASTIIRSIFGGEKSSREGGGFFSTINGWLCKIFGNSICSGSDSPGVDSKDVPINVTYGQLKEAENIIRNKINKD